MDVVRELATLRADVVGCRSCPRLVDWREHVADERRAAYRDQEYWGRPVPGFGDPRARVVIVGLAPGAHGANRTGRMFTGDRSGEWLFGVLHRARFANQSTSVAADDGLELEDAYVSAAVRCVPPDNQPTADERDQCRPYLERELRALTRARVIVALGAFAFDALRPVLAAIGSPYPTPRPRFAHGVEVPTAALTVVGSYHPSQQNTFTGRLTEPMLDAVFSRARLLASG